MTLKLPLRRLPLYLASALLTVVFLLHGIGRIELPLLPNLDHQLYDLRLRLSAPYRQDSRIAIVDIDEKSLAQEGRWPWPRDKLALLANLLFDYYQIHLLGFDMVFAERDDSSGLPLLNRLLEGELRGDAALHKAVDNLRPSLEHDQLFARSLQNRPVILGFFSSHQSDASNAGALPPPLPQDTRQSPALNLLPELRRYTGNLVELQQAARDGGFFSNPLLDDDGIFRRLALLTRQDGQVYKSLSLAMFQALLGQPPLQLEINDYGAAGQERLEALELGNFRIPVDEQSGALIPYLGKQGSFAYYSAGDVINAAIDPERLRGKIVLVGTTAAGLMDLRATPMQNVYPGVEVHANLLAGMLDQTIKERPAYVKGLEFLQTLLVGSVLMLWVPRLAAGTGTVLSMAVLLLLGGANYLAWQKLNIAVDSGAPMVLLFLLYTNHMFFGYALESRNKKRLASQFGQYVPPELVDEMSQQESDFAIGGESREMTVLFSDVRGFTTISEGLPPQELSQLMNQFLTPLTRVIHEHKGTIDKYMGDAIMAFWGAPLRDERHASHAVQAALNMLRAVEQIQPELKARGWPPIKVGVGLNTGPMSVGNMGSEFRMAYTVLGDAVNLGSRLEGITKQYGVSVIVSETTQAAAPEFAYRELDQVRVKGKHKPVVIYEPLGLADEVPTAALQEIAQHQAALAAYRSQDWDTAQQRFSELAQAQPQRLLYSIYLERVAYFREHPPGDDWDGAFTFQTK
jgi:adenylate cyclase